MALMFPRVAYNYAKNGYYPTDDETLMRLLSAFLVASEDESCRVLDPCAGEGIAIANIAAALNREQTQVYTVEYNTVRAAQAKRVSDVCLRSDFFDTVISLQSFGLLFLNPPYGDISIDDSALSRYRGKGRPRLEKAFYQTAVPLLQFGGVLVLIIPRLALDEEFVGWICNHFTEISVHEVVDKQFNQIVIMGVRTRIKALGQRRKVYLSRFHDLIDGKVQVDELPENWDSIPYVVPTVTSPLNHFYRISIESEQFLAEIQRLKGLWPSLATIMAYQQTARRQPLTKMSDWHLALALASGEIEGIVTAKTGRTFIIKGDTYKEKRRAVEYEVDDDDNITERIILTDKFVPVIKAWDITKGSPQQGQLLTITSAPASVPTDIDDNTDDLSGVSPIVS